MHLVFLLSFLGAQLSTMDAKGTKQPPDLKTQEARTEALAMDAVANRLREADPTLPETGARREATAIVDAAAHGAFKRFGATQSEQVEIAASVWAAALHNQSIEPRHYKMAGPYSRITAAEIEQTASGMGKVVVTSSPDGASISVDGHPWKRKTNDSGYAYEGRRQVLLSTNNMKRGVTCNVKSDRTATVSVDFNSGAATCK